MEQQKKEISIEALLYSARKKLSEGTRLIDQSFADIESTLLSLLDSLKNNKQNGVEVNQQVDKKDVIDER